MGPYKDSETETKEALRKAFRDGYVIEVLEHDQRVGIAVITRTVFDYFQPHYHLAYIAIDSTNRGNGLGKRLLHKVEKVTKGNIALHVSQNNKNAISFYEKMGWQTNYLRMMPSKPPQQMTE